MLLFTFIGTLLIIYVIYAIARGEVYAKSRAWGKRIYRDDAPREFWTVIFIYTALSIALLAFF
jgi:hypothetical protein